MRDKKIIINRYSDLLIYLWLVKTNIFKIILSKIFGTKISWFQPYGNPNTQWPGATN